MKKISRAILCFIIVCTCLNIQARAVDYVSITHEMQVVDSFNGVDAVYHPNAADGTNTTYSCAAYVARYYRTVYNVTVSNMFTGRTPAASSGSFSVTNSPEPGDVGYQTNSSGSGHWFIIKSVNGNGTYTIIEQNWKKDYANTAPVNRVVGAGTSGFKVFRWSGKGPTHIPYGAIDAVIGGTGTIRIYGWAKDDDEPDTALNLHVYIDGPAGVGKCIKSDIIAGNDSSDVGKHRFDVTFNTDYEGEHSIYVYAINAGAGNHNPLLSGSPKTITITPRNHIPYGAVDIIEGGKGTIRIAGWAKDDDEPDTALTLHVYIDGDAAVAKCIKSDIVAGNDSSDVGKHRFDVTFETDYIGEHSIYVYAINAGAGNHNPLLSGSPKTIVIKDPIPPVVTGCSLNVNSSQKSTVTVTATDNVGIDHVDIRVKNGSNVSTYAASKSSGNNWSKQVTYDLSGGKTAEIEATVYDAAGNKAASSKNTDTPCVYAKLQYVTVSLNANGGSCSTSSANVLYARLDNNVKNSSTYCSLYGALPNASRSGYTFNGWYTAASGGSQVTASTQVKSSTAHTLYAHWIENEYTVTYTSEGNVSVPQPQIKHGGSNLILSSYVPARKGYIFDGWTDGTDNYHPGDTFTANADTTLTAVWVSDTEFVLPSNASVIEEEAFVGAPFTCVVIPANYVSIGPRAFADCPNLKYVVLLGDNITIDDTAFENSNVTILQYK